MTVEQAIGGDRLAALASLARAAGMDVYEVRQLARDGKLAAVARRAEYRKRLERPRTSGRDALAELARKAR